MEFQQVGTIDQIQVYPIKSCRGQFVDSWPVCKYGLLHDREFAVFSHEAQKCLSLRHDTRMRHIQPFLDLERQTLRLTCVERDNAFDNGKERDAIPEFPSIELKIEPDDALKLRAEADSFTVACINDKVEVIDCGKEAQEFVERVFGEEGFSLVRNAFDKRFSYGKKETAKYVNDGYANAETDARRDELDRIRQLMAVAERSKVALPDESQYLLATRSSLQQLSKALKETLSNGRFDLGRVIDRMRPNIIVKDTLTSGFGEENWRHVRFGSGAAAIELDVSGPCKRCPATVVEIDTGVSEAEPLSTLNKIRNKYQYFGVNANYSEQQRHELKRLRRLGSDMPRLRVGDPIYASEKW